MSSIRETAEREANEAEQDDLDEAEVDGDTEGDETIDGEPDAGATPVLTPEQIDARKEKLQKEADRHAKRVAEIMGEDFRILIPSPIDWTPGFIFHPDFVSLSPEQIAAVDDLIGRAGRSEYQAAKDAEPCPDCNALGQVLTGSRVPGQETKPCLGCNGAGWKTIVPAQPQAPLYAVQQQFPGAGVTSVNGMQVADQWGRAAGHPHYGRDPSSVGV